MLTSALRKSVSRLLTFFVLVILVFSIFPHTATGLGGSDFKAGRIIDDAFFFNSYDMSVSDIQNFLNSKVPTCSTNHTKSSSTSDPGPPYTCLKDYTQTIPERAADSYCSGSVSAGTKSAAQLIKDVSVACSINPKIILITLQKEQSLITDTWPWPVQYDHATGYACPDTAPCDPAYSGFFNQIWYSARQFQRYAKSPNSYSYKRGISNYIQYNPNAGCGGTNVFIENQATAGLYNYTPYQPNAAALNNLYGSGDGCSAYGNRNFWRLYNDWFGATTSDSNSNFLRFLRLNHSSGNVEIVSYSSIGDYSYTSTKDLTSYPAVLDDGAVVPLFRFDGNLSFVRLNHSSGNVEIVTYSHQSGFKQLLGIERAGYPAVNPDGAVIPAFRPNGDLSFIRLNHSSGNVEVVTYSVKSGFRKLVGYNLTSYPAVVPDGAVIPLFRPDGNLSFIRLNSTSGNVEIVTYSHQSGFKQLLGIERAGYPAVAADGAVVPLFTPSGKELSFVRLNHTSGNAEVVSYSVRSGFRQISGYTLTAYPAVLPHTGVHPFITQ